jgi:ABC-type branched-subunit amino acid transport system substrate-binding protein
LNALFKILIILFIFIFVSHSKEVNVGMSADFSGPIAYIGNNMKIGVETYLNKINKTSKHKFKLISYDDQYNPTIASSNVRKLIDEDNVIALLGNLGTPTANVVIPILTEKKIVLFGPYSGGNVLREKVNNDYVFNYRASYSQESYTITSNLLKLGVRPQEIAIFTQNDTYGDSGYSGVVKAFREYGYKDIKKVAHGRYTRGSLNIENALSKMLDFDVDFKAIIMVGVDAPSNKFIRYAKEDFPKVKFFSLSPTGIENLAKKNPLHSEDIYVTQVVPILSSNIQIIKEYKEDLKIQFPNMKPNLVSLEGYIVAKLFVQNLRDLEKSKITKEKVLFEITKFPILDIGLGFESSFDEFKHQYCNTIWLTTVRNNKIIEVNWDKVFKD